MKVKGISFIEQHVEKFVLLGVLTLALFFAALQFLSPGYRAEIAGREVPVSEVDEVLMQRADAVRSRLAEGADATIEPPQTPNMLAWFDAQMHQGSVTPNETAIAMLPTMRPFIEGAEVDAPDKEYVVPVLAGTGKPFVEQYADAIEDVDALPQDVRDGVVFGSETTNDITWTTVAANVDLAALRAQLAAEDDDGEKLSVPERWYDGRIYVLDIVAERQRLLENGQWGDASVVPMLQPDMAKHRERVEGNPKFTMSGIQVLLDWLATDPGANQAAIIQPSFFLTKSSLWSPPEPPLPEDERPEMARVADLKGEVDWLEAQIDRVTSQLQELGGPVTEEELQEWRDRNRNSDDDDSGRRGGGGSGPSIPGGGGAGGGGGGSLGGGGGGIDLGGNESGSGGGDNEQTEGAARRTFLRRVALTRELDKRRERLAPLREELNALATQLGLDIVDDGESVREYPNLLTDEEVIVWAHDPFVKPGETYRYRLTVRVYNPFYGKGAFLLPSQQELATHVALEVETSEWSEPVSVQSFTRFFITGASPSAGVTGLSQATVEVFRLYDGVWYVREWPLHPGDPIGEIVQVNTGEGSSVTVDFQTNAYLQDVLRLPESDETTSGPGRVAQGRVVVVQEDGTVVVRNPVDDVNSSDRLELLSYSSTNQRGASRR